MMGNSLKVELVSLRTGLKTVKLKNLLVNAINNSPADIILFCGYTFIKETEISSLQSRILNKNAFVLFEIKNMSQSYSDSFDNGLVVVQNGRVKNLCTSQFFATSQEIEGNEVLCERFIQELENKRFLNVRGRRILVLQCGELNIIKNLQSKGNQPVFRFENRSDLKGRFDDLLSKTDIILNPIHTAMGNQGKMHRKREYLSANNRYYFSASQNKKIKITAKSLQYAYHDGKSIAEFVRDVSNDSQVRVYEI